MKMPTRTIIYLRACNIWGVLIYLNVFFKIKILFLKGLMAIVNYDNS